MVYPRLRVLESLRIRWNVLKKRQRVGSASAKRQSGVGPSFRAPDLLQCHLKAWSASEPRVRVTLNTIVSPPIAVRARTV